MLSKLTDADCWSEIDLQDCHSAVVSIKLFLTFWDIFSRPLFSLSGESWSLKSSLKLLGSCSHWSFGGEPILGLQQLPVQVPGSLVLWPRPSLCLQVIFSPVCPCSVFLLWLDYGPFDKPGWSCPEFCYICRDCFQRHGGLTAATSGRLCALEPTWSRFKRKWEGTGGVASAFNRLC